jgi:hypothetical protein
VAEGIVIIALLVSSIAVGIVSWLAEIVSKLAGFRFGPISWFLHGLGFLVTLPFVLALMVLTFGLSAETWWVGGFILAAAAFSFVGGGIGLIRDLVTHERGTFARR